MALRDRVWSGVKWVAVSMVSISVTRLISIVILTRLLRPEDFGLMGMVMVVITCASSFTDMGLSSAIVQREHCTRNELSSLYWLNMAVGSMLFLVAVATSELTAKFFHEPRLTHLLVLTSLMFLIHPLGMQFKALLQKELRFSTLTYIESASVVAGVVVSVAFAMTHHGVYSLVYGHLAQVSTEIGILVIVGRRWLPTLHFAKSDLKGYVSFGVYSALDRAVVFASQNVDYLIIGRYLGSTTLGYYTLAYTLVSYPQQRISPVLVRVAFPAFSRVKDDEPRLIRGYFQSIFLMSLIGWPLCGWLAVAARPLVLAFCGPSWEKSIILVQILAVIGLVKVLNPLFSAMLMARGRSDRSFVLNIIVCASNALACWIGVRWGIVALAGALATVNVIRHILINGPFLKKLVGVSGWDYMRQLSPSIEGSIVMVLGLISLQSFVMHPLNLLQKPVPMLIWMACIGALLYIATVCLRRPGLPSRIRKIVGNG